MTPLDESPEQRWRRTVDRRKGPAKLKVDRLLRDFGYAELEPEVGDAIEARLAAVALTVAPSLRDAVAGEVVTIYADDGAGPEDERSPAKPDTADRVAAEVPALAADVAQMVGYLKQQVLDARGEAERLRTELDRRNAERLDYEREKESIIAEQAAALEEQRRQLAELGASLISTREALADTREEIRRAVGELQALPGPEALPEPESELELEPAPQGDHAALDVEPSPLEPEPEALEGVEEPELEFDQPVSRAQHEPSDGRAGSVASSDEWLPADLQTQPDDRAPVAAEAPPSTPAQTEPEPGSDRDARDRSTEFDDFLYDVDELYEPDDEAEAAGGAGAPESRIQPRRPDEPTSALPPPPPAPPSPWGEEADGLPPVAGDRPTVAKVLRGRGRGRGRWEGSCSICGRLPLENRRKDLEVAGWDLDDQAAACPQCRGVG